MMDNTNEDIPVPSQRCRTLRDRRGGAIVPGSTMSLSSDGLTGDCTARSPAENAIAKAQAIEYGRAGLPVVSIPSQYVGGEAEQGSSKGKPKIISVEKVEVVPRGMKPGPKSSKRTKEWERPGLEQIDPTGVEDDGEENGEMEEEGQRRLTRSSSRTSVLSVQASSDTSETPSTSGRGRGRPETTGEYRIKKAKMKEMETLDRKRKLEEEIDEIMNPNHPIAPNKVAKIRNEVAEKVEHFRAAPTVDLLSRMTEAADFVMRAAIKSSHLQGVVRGELKKAHYVLAAGTTVLASRVEREEEGDHGKEVALLRIELEMAREDAKRMKEKAASDRRKLEDCLQRMEKMEEAAFTDRGKRKHRPRPLEDEGDEEGQTEDVTMEEAGGEVSTEPFVSKEKVTPPELRPRVVLPPPDEWPPAMRPPIKGVSKRIEDPVLPPLRKEKTLEDKIMERLDAILPRWLEGRGVVLQGKERDDRSTGPKEKGREKPVGKKDQEKRPSQPPGKRDKSRTRTGPPLQSGPTPGAGKSGAPTGETGGRKGEEPWSKVLGRRAKKESKAGVEKERKTPAKAEGNRKVRPVGGGGDWTPQ